ncbi:MAG: amidohydrolase [Lysobacteraceae bacterium]|nr:MAG: amidohydrolase [Xanthomonadaceae bacterium]
MKWIKRLGITFVILIVCGAIMAALANRDMVKIYGGLTSQAPSKASLPAGNSVTVTNVNVLSTDGESFIPGKTVTIVNGLISAIQDHGSLPPSEQTVDGRGKYLIPGLIDAHVHLFKSPNDLLLYIANGVTGVRELIGEPDHLGWREEIEKNHRLGPDMFIASPRIGSFEPVEGFFMEWSQGYINLTNAADAKVAVAEFKRQGYDAVKIYSQINRPVYEAVTRAAKSSGLRVVGHVPWALDLDAIYKQHEDISHLEELMNALNREFGGFAASTSEEFLDFVEQRSDAMASDLAKKNISVTTTLWLVESFVRQKFELDEVLREVQLTYVNPGIAEWTERVPQGGLGWLPKVNRYQLGPNDSKSSTLAWKRKYWQTYAQACRLILRSLIKNDVNIMAGTDANLPPVVPGFSLHDELISLTEAGMSSTQALRSATATPAIWLGNNGGVIEVGRSADLVLLDRNPLQDISNTNAIHTVFTKGRPLSRGLLDQLLQAVKDANDESRTVDISGYVD